MRHRIMPSEQSESQEVRVKGRVLSLAWLTLVSSLAWLTLVSSLAWLTLALLTLTLAGVKAQHYG